MAQDGRVFGSSGEVASLSRLAKMCIRSIDEENQRAKGLLSQLSSSTKDAAYDEAASVVAEVQRLVNSSQEPIQQVCGALDAYAEFLGSMGR